MAGIIYCHFLKEDKKQQQNICIIYIHTHISRYIFIHVCPYICAKVSGKIHKKLEIVIASEEGNWCREIKVGGRLTFPCMSFVPFESHTTNSNTKYFYCIFFCYHLSAPPPLGGVTFIMVQEPAAPGKEILHPSLFLSHPIHSMSHSTNTD